MKAESHQTTKPRSQRIVEIIALSNQVAAVDWLRAMMDEQIELMETTVAPLRQRLHALRTTADEANMLPATSVALAAIAPSSNNGEGSAGYWQSLSPEQRSFEMRRRQAKAKKKQEAAEDLAALHPRDKRSPRHAAWRRKMRQAQRKRFDNLSPGEQARWKARMLEGRRAAL